jgi:hypothetical protein
MAPLGHEGTLMRAVNTNASTFRRASFGRGDPATNGVRDRRYILGYLLGYILGYLLGYLLGYILGYILGGRLVERRRDVQLPSEDQPPSTGRATPFM